MEVARHIFHRAGIETEWIRCATAQGNAHRSPCGDKAAGASDVALHLVPQSMEGYDVPRSAFGLALPSGDERLGRHAYVYRHRVESAAREYRRLSTVTLLAHVVVHEIGHLLLGQGHHDRASKNHHGVRRICGTCMPVA